MRYLLFIATDPDHEEVDASPDAFVEKWNTRCVRIEGMPLREPHETRTVRVRDELIVTHGPFAETTEWIGGYDLLECTDLDAAIEVAASHPMARGGRIEIRPVATEERGAGIEDARHGGDEPTARFMALFRIDPEAPQIDTTAVADWVRAGQRSGRLSAHVPLASVESATLVRVRGGELLVTDGAYTDLDGWVTAVAFVDGEWEEAVDYVGSAPMARTGAVELREFAR